MKERQKKNPEHFKPFSSPKGYFFLFIPFIISVFLFGILKLSVARFSRCHQGKWSVENDIKLLSKRWKKNISFDLFEVLVIFFSSATSSSSSRNNAIILSTLLLSKYYLKTMWRNESGNSVYACVKMYLY